jgi:hypothetical protein
MWKRVVAKGERKKQEGTVDLERGNFEGEI